MQCLSCGTAPLTNVGWHDSDRSRTRSRRITIGVIAVSPPWSREARACGPGRARAAAVRPRRARPRRLRRGRVRPRPDWFVGERLDEFKSVLVGDGRRARDPGRARGRGAVEQKLSLGGRRPRGRARALAAWLGQGALARTLGDPSLETRALAPRAARVRRRRRSHPRASAPGRDARDGARRGGRTDRALVHDPALLEQRALRRGRRAARFALENERLQAEPGSSSTRCVPRGPGSSRPATTSAAGSSATSTTARSSGCSAWASRSSSPARSSARGGRRGRAARGGRSGARSARRAARARAGHPPGDPDRAGWPPRSARLPSARRPGHAARLPEAARRAGRGGRLLPRPGVARERGQVRARLPRLGPRRRARRARARRGRGRRRRRRRRVRGSGLRGLSDRLHARWGARDREPSGARHADPAEIPCAS